MASNKKLEFVDYYQVLRVWPTASEDAIKKAYFSLAKLYHPDVVGKAGAEQKDDDVDFKLVNEAYAVLSDAAKRREFDEALRQRQGSKADKGAAPAAELDDYPSDHRINRRWVSDGADAEGEPIGHWEDDPDHGWRRVLRDVLGQLPPNLKCALQCDIYDGPLGQGFQLTMYVKALGEIYARTVQHGPETWRAYNWQKVEDGP